jgi:hypothetical protein
MADKPTDVFPNFSALFQQAAEMSVRITPATAALLMSAIAHLPAFKQLSAGRQAEAGAEWYDLLVKRRDRTLQTADIWEWIKKWFLPDPVQAMRIWRYILSQSKTSGGDE